MIKSDFVPARIMSWNIQDWGDRAPGYERERGAGIAKAVKNVGADIIFFMELMKPSLVLDIMRRALPGYIYLPVENPNERSLMVAYRHVAHREITAYTCEQFMGADRKMRSYPLLEIKGPIGTSGVLGVHAKSGSTRADYKIRQNSLPHIWKIADHYERAADPFIAMGDFNPVGNGQGTRSEDEVKFLQRSGKRAGMTLLPKGGVMTWSGEGPDIIFADADLDHIFASRAAKERLRPVRDGGRKVEVGGEPKISDHRHVLCCLNT